MKVLAVYNIKGGVGKTATAVNLAYLAAQEGRSTLVWDLDPQGAASFYLRIRPAIRGSSRKLLQRKDRLHVQVKASDFAGLDLVPADFSYRNLDLLLEAAGKPKKRIRRLLKPLASQYDLVILDCPPSISLMSESVFAAADALLVPTVPTHLSLRTLAQLQGHLDDAGLGELPVWPFFCMADRRRKLHRETMERRGELPWSFLATAVGYSSDVEKMGDHRAPLPSYAPRRAASRSFAGLWTEVRDRLEAR